MKHSARSKVQSKSESENGMNRSRSVGSEWKDRLIRMELEQCLLTGSGSVSSLWERVRFDVYKRIAMERRGITTGLRQGVYSQKSVAWLVRAGFRVMVQSLNRNYHVLLRRNRQFVFWCDPRRRLINRQYWDIWLDPLIDRLPPADVLSFEPPWALNHFEPSHTNKIVFGDVFLGIARVLGILRPRSLTNYEKRRFAEARHRILTEFKVDVPVLTLARSAKSVQAWEQRLFVSLFRWIRPKVLFLTVSYARENLIEAARQVGVVSVEIQHGVITPTHMGYSYPNDLKKAAFPDYLLTFGKYWVESVCYPVEKNRIIELGYPYLTESIVKYSDLPKVPKSVTFVSQGRPAEGISKKAVELAMERRPGIQVRVKLHPIEYSSWKKLNPELHSASLSGLLKVYDSDEKPLHEILAESEIVIGKNSTVLFEALLFSCRLFVYELPGHEYMNELIENGHAELIRFDCPFPCIEDSKKAGSVDREYFFRSDWQLQFSQFLKNEIGYEHEKSY